MASEGLGALTSSKSQDWGSPSAIADPCRDFLGGFDLDPASSKRHNKRIKASWIFTEKEDGLAQPWCLPNGDPASFWSNPPYGQLAAGEQPPGFAEGIRNRPGIWVQKVLKELEEGRVSRGFMLLHAKVGDDWFRPLYRFPVCLMKRIRFVPPPDQPKTVIGKDGKEKKWVNSPSHPGALTYVTNEGPSVWPRLIEELGHLGQWVLPTDSVLEVLELLGQVEGARSNGAANGHTANEIQDPERIARAAARQALDDFYRSRRGVSVP